MGGNFKIKLIIGLVMVGFALFRYYSSSQLNPVTGETQHVNMTPEQEVAIGLQSAPEMAAQHGGLHPDPQAQEMVDRVGQKLLNTTTGKKSAYQYDFHLLADPETINAFALPGGQVFITAALYSKLENEDQLAGVLGHEIGHVIERHSAERMAKQELTQGITGAAVMAAYDPSNPATQNTAQVAQMIGGLITMKYGRDQELESDDWGVRLMIEAGYKPEEMIGVMEILKQAAGGRETNEFSSSHPSPENRAQKIKESIQKYGYKPQS